MADRTDRSDFSSAPVFAMPSASNGTRLTEEQLAAAQRTLEYHVRKLQSHLGSRISSNDVQQRSQ